MAMTDDPLRLAVALLARLVLDALDDVGGLDLGLVLERADQLLARLLGGQPGDVLEPLADLAGLALELLVAVVGHALAAGEGLLAPGEVAVALVLLLLALVEGVFLLGEAALDRLELGAALARRGLELGAGDEQLLLGDELGFADLRLAFAARLLEQAVGLAVRLGDGLPRRAPALEPGESQRGQRRDQAPGDPQNGHHPNTPGRGDDGEAG